MILINPFSQKKTPKAQGSLRSKTPQGQILTKVVKPESPIESFFQTSTRSDRERKHKFFKFNRSRIIIIENIKNVPDEIIKKTAALNYSPIHITRDPFLDLIENIVKNRKESRVMTIRL